jgi:RNA polymerase sigma-70 factor (ECF subfamily)
MQSELTQAEGLAERLAPALLGYFARRVLEPADAADLVGETFLVLWRRAAEVPKDPDLARMWAFGVARRVLSTYHRSGTRRSALAARLRAELEVTGEETHADPQVIILREALDRLDPLDRELVRLVHWDGFTLIEAAQLLGKRPGTVRSRYHRARQRLRTELSVTTNAPSEGS